MTVLHLGRSLDEEARALYLALGASAVPPGDADRELLATLAAWCVDGEQPAEIPVRENRAVINRVRLANDRPLLVDTVTDVLRLACALAGGDVSLAEPTAFRSLPRPLRKGLMTALESVVATTPAKLGDVARHRERWKRLGERLHPHEYPELPHAQDVFAVARGDRRVRSLAGRVEMALAEGDLPAAVRAPVRRTGTAVPLRRPAAARGHGRRARRRARRGGAARRRRVRSGAASACASTCRTASQPDAARIFVNRTARAWVAEDRRRPARPRAGSAHRRAAGRRRRPTAAAPADGWWSIQPC